MYSMPFELILEDKSSKIYTKKKEKEKERERKKEEGSSLIKSKIFI